MDFEKVGVQREGAYTVACRAVDVLSAIQGVNSRRDRISAETILASAAIPTFFRSCASTEEPTGTASFAEPPDQGADDEKAGRAIGLIQINLRARG